MNQKGSSANLVVTAEQLRAARALLGWSKPNWRNGLECPFLRSKGARN